MKRPVSRKSLSGLIRLMILLSSLPFFALVKISVFDQTTVAFSDYRLDLELEGFKTPRYSTLLDEN
jgi:hypothetical protein